MADENFLKIILEVLQLIIDMPITNAAPTS